MGRTKQSARHGGKRASAVNGDNRENSTASSPLKSADESAILSDVPSKKRKRGREEERADEEVAKSTSDVANEEPRKKKKKGKKDKKSEHDQEHGGDVAVEPIMPKPLIPAKDLYPGLDSSSDRDGEGEAVPNKPRAMTEEEREQRRERRREKKKAKREANKQAKKEAREAQDAETEAKAKTTNTGEPKSTEGAAEGVVEGNGDESKSSKTRFIVFIGNLPFSATKTSVSEHFATLKPMDVRVLTERNNPAKSKGTAFVEFDNYDRMKTCLEKFHHSEFNDGISPARKINVELTAGGGGKTQDRKAKITEKNRKLNEERVRRAEKEVAAKAERQKEAAAKAQKTQEKEQDDIHPSRRGRVPARGKKW